MFSVEHPKLLRRCGLSTIRSRSPVSILNVSEIYRAISNDCISAMRAGFIRLLVDQPRSIPFAANLVLTLPVSCYSCHSLPPPARPPAPPSIAATETSQCLLHPSRCCTITCRVVRREARETLGFSDVARLAGPACPGTWSALSTSDRKRERGR